jgi:hypothetical protein
VFFSWDDSAVVGGIFKVHVTPVSSPWIWTLSKPQGCYRDNPDYHGPNRMAS